MADRNASWLEKKSRTLAKWLGKTWKSFDSKDPIMVLPYKGYASRDRVHVKGRVIENEQIVRMGQNPFEAAVNSFKRLESDEIPNAKVRVEISGQLFEVSTDEEGYFELDEAWNNPPERTGEKWIYGTAEIVSPYEREKEPGRSVVSLLYPDPDAEYGIISDVDDTVLQSHMTSRFKWRMLYTTIFKDLPNRKAMEGVVPLYQAMAKGSSGSFRNPVFYVSNSPWNFYDLITDFLDLHKLPAGPLMLRDFGLPFGARHIAFKQHKIDSIRNILKTYPKMKFIMLGDTASNDADFYLDMSDEFDGQVQAVYIRKTKNNKNARRVAQLIENHSHAHAHVVTSSKQIFDHARKAGFIA